MTWRKAMNRRRAARLAQELPAVARPSEGPAELQPGVSSLNSAGVSSQVAPAVFSGQPTAQDIRACVAEGMADQQIADCFGKSKSWALNARRKHGIDAAVNQGRHPVDSGPAFGFVPGAAHEARYAAFFAAHGRYTSYSDRQISNYERAIELTRLNNRPTIDMAPILYGDPAPDRPRA